MLDSINTRKIEKVIFYQREFIGDTIINEFPFTISLNGRELVTLLCTPMNLEYLALGFLQSEGFISDRSAIQNIEFNKESGYINIQIVNGETIMEQKMIGKRTLTSGCGKGTTFHDVINTLESQPINTELFISMRKIYDLVDEMQKRSLLFKQTGAAHISTLASNQEILFVHEDIGRHNALDKLFGECLLKQINYTDKVIVTSGRISSEMLIKCALRRIPILISRSAATDLAIELALKSGITLIGFVRNERMNIYANGWRVLSDLP